MTQAALAVAKRILDHLHLDSTGPPLAPARRVQADSADPEPAYDVATPRSGARQAGRGAVG